MNKIAKLGLLVYLLAVIGYFGANYFVASQAEKQAQAMVEKVNARESADAKVSYADLSASAFGTTVTLNDVKIGDSEEARDLNIETIDLSGLNPESEFPQKIIAKNITGNVGREGESEVLRIGSVTIDGLPQDKSGDFPAHFSAQIDKLELDLSEIEKNSKPGETAPSEILSVDPDNYGVTYVDGQFVMDYDAEQKMMAANMVQGMEDLFGLKTDIELHGFEARKGFFNILKEHLEADRKPSPDALFVGMGDLALARLQIQFSNEGLVENIWEAKAKEEGKATQQYKQEVLAQLDYTVQSTGWSSQLINEALAELKKFNENPEKLSISVAPMQAIKFTEFVGGVLLDLEGFIKKLNIKVEAT